MPGWPHSPVHRLSDAGTYIVTAGTYGKVSFFRTRTRLEFLCKTLLELAAQYGWNLQAWAVFPNHYHFVAQSPAEPQTLKRLVQHLHSRSAREVNAIDQARSRRVWFEYWESRITFEKSFLARLSYVHRNAVHHGLVREPSAYPWCSAGWFAQKARPAFFRTVMSFTGQGIRVQDDFVVEATDIE
jgi:putative transposase